MHRGWEIDADLLDRVVTGADYPALEALAKSVVKDKQKFERLVLTKAQLLEMFYVRSLPKMPVDVRLTLRNSTTPSKSTSSTTRLPTVPPRLSTDVDPWSTSVSVLTSPTRDE
jgi:hypothetical protein